jgi:radical SAM superfamily enzyme YgiQ (UPF0313 family)
MRVLLVYANQARELLPAPPIGLAYVASATRDAGHDVRVLDLLHRRAPVEAMRSAVEAWEPEVVGISVRNIDNVVHQRLAWHLGGVADLVAATRRQGRAAIVLGGPAISILGARALDRFDADFAVTGEGERTFPRLLAAIEHGTSPAGIPGVCSREGSTIAATPPMPLERFGDSEMERWIDWPAYERRGSTWAIQTKRGCPMRCAYCAYPAIEGRGLRRRPPSEVVDEIEHVAARVGPRTFEIVDSTFNLPTDHAEAICEEIVRRGLHVNLTAMGVNPQGVSERLFALMRRAGFNSMMITPEAASETMLRSLGKGFTVEDVHRTARLARTSGLSSTWFFMLGGPGETPGTVEETVSFVESQLDWPRCLSIFMTGIRVLPGTDLARRAVAEGSLPADADLAEPTFYFSPGVPEAWMLDRINQAIGRCPGIVHAAEEGGSTYERMVDRMLHLAGVAPPYWRFLPLMLRVPPIPSLRRRHPPVVGAASPPCKNGVL